MGYDKRQAKKGKWRVPESNLIFVSLLGGGIGELLHEKSFIIKREKRNLQLDLWRVYSLI